MTMQINSTPEVHVADPTAAEAAARKEDAVKVVAVDHRFLKTAMHWLESAREEAAIASMLEDLQDYLKGHFEAEERDDGFFEHVLTEAPGQQSYVDQLRREHGEVSEEIDALRGTIEAPYEDATNDLIEGVANLVGTIREHEQREATLLQDVYDRDYGGGD